jgi:CheY-like chemotaxis protein
MVDDEEDLVWITSKQMARARPEIILEGFLDPLEALERIRESPPDLLVSDVQMPKMNGLELLIAARRVVPNLPVVVITAFGTAEVKHEVMKRGSVSYLEKPFSFASFLEVIDPILAARSGFSGAISLPMLPDLVQIYALSSSTGALRIDRGGQTGAIWFERGQIVHAECGDLRGEEAFHALIAWQGGRFWLETASASPERTITDSWQTLLIEGCRRLDEATAMRKEDVPALRKSDWEGLEKVLRDGLPGAWVEAIAEDVDTEACRAAAGLLAPVRELPGMTERGIVELVSSSSGIAVFWDRANGILAVGDDVSSRSGLTRLRNAVVSGARSLWP